MTEAAGLAEEDREDIKLLVMIYTLEMCNNQPECNLGRLLTFGQGIVYSLYKNGGRANASLLREVPCQKGNEGCQIYNYEEREASNSGCVPDMRY